MQRATTTEYVHLTREAVTKLADWLNAWSESADELRRMWELGIANAIEEVDGMYWETSEGERALEAATYRMRKLTDKPFDPSKSDEEGSKDR